MTDRDASHDAKGSTSSDHIAVRGGAGGAGGGMSTTNSTIASLVGHGGRQSRLIIDSDDDMDDDDDDDDDDDLLIMPTSSQKIELQIDQTLSGPTSSFDDFPSLDHDTVSAQNQTHAISLSVDDNNNDDEEEDLFGQDFMEQFGKDGEIELESNQNNKTLPLFPRRIPLLRVTEDETHNDEINHHDLGLERLSISQKHRTLSGEQVFSMATKEAIKTTTSGSSTTIISNMSSKFNMLNRLSMPLSLTQEYQESSQQEEELLEMSARQHDVAMLDNLILEDELYQDEEEDDLGDRINLQYHEQALQREQPQSTDHLSDTADTHKRKHAAASSTTGTSSTPTLATTEEIDNFLEGSYTVGGNSSSSARRTTEASKKTRLEHASTGSINTRDTTKSAAPNVHDLLKRLHAPEVPKHDYTLPPETGSFIRARSSSGQTFYLAKKVRVDNAKNSFMQQVKECTKNMKSLLSIPIHRMMDELDAEIKIQKQEAINRLEYGDYDGEPEEPEDDNNKNLNERLWVDKYRPKKYMDLMGDERVNREVLSWIKEWDQCVFGRKYKKYTPEHKQQYFKEFRKPDPLGRPDRKILLITGPPGLGKTTMAHVIAKQAGYNVIEVNASDDRTGATIKDKIESVLEIQSILGSGKPNLLIIDEVDGVSSSGGEQSFIKLLVDIATIEGPSNDEKKLNSKRSKKPTKNPLMRPIICICNDQYAPVLRPLRIIAQIYQFKKPSVRSVVTRLQQICEMEQIPSDTRAFGALYEMTEGDMRSCLNTLQFIKIRIKTNSILAATPTTGRIGSAGRGHGSGLTLEALNKATIGRKDQSKSLFAIWEELFQASYARKNRSALKVMEDGRDGLVKGDSNTYVNRMVTLVQTNGDYEKLIQGCFENFPTMVFHDVAMSKVVECGDWLAFYDQLNARITSNFEYEVGGYVGYVLVNFHRIFAGSVRQKIEYPRKDYESFVAHKANETILQGMILDLPAKAQRYYRKTNFATEYLSPFLRILSPYLRPVNKQLIKPAERVILLRLVEVMIYFKLTFVQEKTEDGQFLYRLEPSIDRLDDFSGIGLKNVLPNRYAIRQLISQEIELELVRRIEAAKEEKKKSPFLFDKDGGKNSMSMDTTTTTTGASLETSSASGPSLSLKDKKDTQDFERAPVDFFGRPIVQTKNTLGSEDAAGGSKTTTKKTRIWYKFNEGFSNAVKAKVFIDELI